MYRLKKCNRFQCSHARLLDLARVEERDFVMTAVRIDFALNHGSTAWRRDEAGFFNFGDHVITSRRRLSADDGQCTAS